MTMEDVASGFIGTEAARAIARRYPRFDPASIEGIAFDTLFKQLCAEQALATPEGHQVLAPFAFVSGLAGALLAVELQHLAHDGGGGDRRANYWAVSPWAPPIGRARRIRPASPDCEFCSRPESRAALSVVWADAFAAG